MLVSIFPNHRLSSEEMKQRVTQTTSLSVYYEELDLAVHVKYRREMS
jgi:hypothetical protein